MAEWLDAPPESVPWETHAQTMNQARELRAELEGLLDEVEHVRSYIAAIPGDPLSRLYRVVGRLRENK